MEMTLPKGYRMAGVACGIKADASKRDLALFVSDADASAAGVFTTNRVCAAPVHACRRRLPASDIRAVVINSGNANACTGEQGLADAERMTELVGAALGCESDQVLVGSTGIIGRLLPMPAIESGIAKAAQSLGSNAEATMAAAFAIQTTDTKLKISSRAFEHAGKTCRVMGIAKGAAMIGPKMATMLSVVMTDARVQTPLLDRVLRSAVDRSFHCVSVEGHTSTNDSVLLLANGASGAAIDAGASDAFAAAVEEVCIELARSIAEDAEGASHLITIEVTGARNDEEAMAMAKAIANSPLVKTAVYGNDPNWGRIVSAAGYAGVEFEEREVSLRVNGVLLYDGGAPTPFDETAESERMKASREVKVELILTQGDGRCRFWTGDLTNEYVHLNADYTT